MHVDGSLVREREEGVREQVFICVCGDVYMVCVREK